MPALSGKSDGPGTPGVRGDAVGTANDGVQGFATHTDHVGVLGVGGGAGVKGDCPNGDGVQGFSRHSSRAGVIGVNSAGGVGVKGDCPDGDGVQGFTQHADRSGVVGSNNGTGVGVRGQSNSGVGVQAASRDNVGLIASGGQLAALFDGNVEITDTLKVKVDIQLSGADIAEQFTIADDAQIDPGSVVVLAGADSVRLSDQPYDQRVAGVISGAGNYHPGLVLDRHAEPNRLPLALTGKVWCKVDAGHAPVEPGDLLTTSPTPGHAMRATDAQRAFGAVIGKALEGLPSGRALVAVLVTLQ